jgi:hypothetical protein
VTTQKISTGIIAAVKALELAPRLYWDSFSHMEIELKQFNAVEV